MHHSCTKNALVAPQLLLLQIYKHKQIHFLNETSMNTRGTDLCVSRWLCWCCCSCWCRRGFLFLLGDFDFDFLLRSSHCLSIRLGLLLRAHDSYTPTIANSSFPSSINWQCLKTTLRPWKLTISDPSKSWCLAKTKLMSVSAVTLLCYVALLPPSCLFYYYNLLVIK